MKIVLKERTESPVVGSDGIVAQHRGFGYMLPEIVSISDDGL